MRRVIRPGGSSGGGFEPPSLYTLRRWQSDHDTGRPLVARISDVRKSTAVAWLVGKPPQDVDLRGALLTRDPATPPDDLARRKAVTGSQGGDS